MPAKVIQYICNKCGSVYSSYEEARACELAFHNAESLKAYEPWKWYILSFTNNKEYTFPIFVKKVDVNIDDNCCLNNNIALFKYNSNDIYSVPRTYIIIDCLSVMDGYIKHGLLVDPYFRSACTKKWFGTWKIPIKVAEDIDETYRLEKANLAKQYGAMSHEQLVNTLVNAKFPNIDPDFSFVELVTSHS